MLIQKRKHPRGVVNRLRGFMPHIDGYQHWLECKGYTAETIVELHRLLAAWADWCQIAGFDIETIAAGFDASATIFKGGRTARAPRGAAALFIRYLREQNILPQAPRERLPTETWPLLGMFRNWMLEQRGAANSTLDNYQSTIVDLLAALGDDPGSYTAVAVRDFVLARAKPHSRERACGIAVATRAFLRFLIATRQCPVGLDYAVPRFARWQLASTPHYLGPESIDRVIAACNGEDRLRDRAIVLLLVRLGLRAGEVANLTLSQIDWKNARLTIAGKSRREERMPLTQEVGDAIIAYIERARPRTPTPRLFITEMAPIIPVSRIAIKCIVKRALDRAGVESAHRGAHVLRHSAATAMLREGVSLAGIGAVLRHRSPSVTALYAKVDIALLSGIAQPWVGRLPC